MKIRKRTIRIFSVLFALIVLIVAWRTWERLASPTKIALIDFQPFQIAGMVKSNSDSFIEYEEVAGDAFDRLGRYDFVLGFGMGMRISAEQRAQIQRAADKGVPVYIHAATNPENNICSLDSVQRNNIAEYLKNGNKRNYQSMARYVRRAIDAKTFFVTPPDSVVELASDVLYHLDENFCFKELADYETYLKKNRFYRDNAPKVALVGGLNDPFGGNRDNIDSIITAFERAGWNVYPVSSARMRLDFLKKIQPDAVVYFAHGRLAPGQADTAVEWLKERNIPVFAPLSLLQTQAQWEADPMGMSGGFLSQSIVMPELDGSIYPYVLNVQEIDGDGLYLFKAIPERLKSFTEIVTNFVRLKRKPNADKKLAVYYFKGAGQATLTAQGLETVPSLYNFLKRLKAEGYRVDNLPSSVKEFEKLLMTQGAVLSAYAEGAFDDFLLNGNPALVEAQTYESWAKQSLPEALYAEAENSFGAAPGRYMSVREADKSYLAVARIMLGNIALLPQPMAGLGNDAFAIVHGTKSPPPHAYIGAYLWAQHGFNADAMLHFGTHGSLEFTPQKQVATGCYDWPDRLAGDIPHFYYYTIGNIGESMMAKRRAYATTVSYLTPAFMETGMRVQFKALQDMIRKYYQSNENERTRLAGDMKKLVEEMGLHRDLRLDTATSNPYTHEEIERIDDFAEEIANEKMTGHLYTSGVPYSREKIRSTVLAMSADPIAYSLAALDRLNGRTTERQTGGRSFFTQQYLVPAQRLAGQILDGKEVNDALICSVARIVPKDLEETKTILAPPRRSMPAFAASDSKPVDPKKSSGGGHPSWIPKFGSRPESTKTDRPAAPEKPETYTTEQKNRARAIAEIERTMRNVTRYETALKESPEEEFRSLLNALSGGYVVPSSGGDAVANPSAVPTGRNLYAVNAEATPSEVAWDKGVALAKATLEQYRKQHGDYPRKVSYTFWSSEFIETEGATVAQAMYMLGVEPVRDPFGRVSDLRLIPSAALGRPRIDVVVQTSGQFRDLAASRLALISRAVEMSASAKDDGHENRVSASVVETERLLVEQGVAPKDAREMAMLRIFGGINGMYGSGIQEMITSGDRWENEKEIADTYIHNMGATYSDKKDWGAYHDGLLRAALHSTDIVVQPRQSNTWGALSLDHVYEFMGGMNLAVRSVTGKDPEAYFADYRNRNSARMQELKEAIAVEARSTIFNPAYIRELMNGNASSAAQITEAVTNTYGWNVMKPAAIDSEMWDKLHDVYVKDEYRLGTEAFFRRENPQALQEITAVMLETARKGLWKASEQQLSDIVRLHVELVNEFGSSASGFAGGNLKLQDFIAGKLDNASASDYTKRLKEMRTSANTASLSGKDGVTLKKDTLNREEQGETNRLNALIVAAVVMTFFIALLIARHRKKK
ncbi:MAG: cobaltochelatase subunit CobN [Prevotellaceae bacterium]|jgi:cobaltochelatase CobN|nr:cobaltochelatase subunit CobN [Prevotellaceae bacterium]